MTPPPSLPPGNPRTDPGAPPYQPWWRLHLWQLQPVFDVLVIVIVAFLFWAAYLLRAATIPALCALFLAYLLDPMISAAHRRFGWPRAFTTSLCVLLLLVVFIGSAAWLVPQIIADGRALAANVPAHVDRLLKWSQESGWLKRIPTPLLNPSALPDAQTLLASALDAFGTFAALLGAAAYSALSMAYTLALFVYFSIKLHELPRAERFLPRSRRAALMDMLGRFEQAFGGFLRGQVMVALFTTTGFLIGFSVAGVPHAPLAAAIGGLLSFIPNGQLSGMLLAVIFGVLEAGAHVDVLPVFLYPTIVYLITQSLETFVVTPWVQASQTRLHPLIIVAALMTGGSLGGVLGVFLAIPTAACVKIITHEVLVPALRRYADRT